MTEFLLSYKNRIHEEDYSLLEEFVAHCLQGIREDKILVLVGETQSDKLNLISDIMKIYKDKDVANYPCSIRGDYCCDITDKKLLYYNDPIDIPFLKELLSTNEEDSFKGNIITDSCKPIEDDIFLNIRMYKTD
jgi:hypothetical protein